MRSDKKPTMHSLWNRCPHLAATTPSSLTLALRLHVVTVYHLHRSRKIGWKASWGAEDICSSLFLHRPMGHVLQCHGRLLVLLAYYSWANNQRPLLILSIRVWPSSVLRINPVTNPMRRRSASGARSQARASRNLYTAGIRQLEPRGMHDLCAALVRLFSWRSCECQVSRSQDQILGIPSEWT